MTAVHSEPESCSIDAVDLSVFSGRFESSKVPSCYDFNDLLSTYACLHNSIALIEAYHVRV